jgi:hypothetical protein
VRIFTLATVCFSIECGVPLAVPYYEVSTVRSALIDGIKK